MALSENDLWLLSFYRNSEITGALFFGRIARLKTPGELQRDITQHFADEANHASLWTSCITELGHEPLKVRLAYQNQYFDVIGAPANLMEVLAITWVFEKRTINFYRRHQAFPAVHPRVRETLERIMVDERWHLQYVRTALTGMEHRHGKAHIDDTLARYAAADREVYERTVAEYGDRAAFLAVEQEAIV